jgi:hypothetical protein
MKNYEIREKTIYTGEKKYVIMGLHLGDGYYFAGYNFMGGVEWETDILSAYYMERDEAEQILSDLESADAPAEPEQPKQYLLKTDIEGEPIAKVMTATEIATMYRDDQLCGIYGELKVYDITNEPVRISLLDLVEPIISHWEWMDREYRDYCEAERYGEV